MAFATRIFGDIISGQFVPEKKKINFTNEYLVKVMKLWGKIFLHTLPDIPIQGSPERSLYRTVVEDSDNNKYILEQIGHSNIRRKEKIAGIIEFFKEKNLAVTPNCQLFDNTHLGEIGGKYWLLTPFVQGNALNRREYWNEGWRGKASAEFLIKMREASESLDFGEKVFSLPEYIETLVRNIRNKNIDLYQVLKPTIEYLRREFFPHYSSIPISFAHGDPHPLNIIWGDSTIISVIDWEFCGLKPVLYDVALIIGCVGSESPKALFGNFIKEFLINVTKHLIHKENGLQYLSAFIIALRFAWLSEWLRRQDKEMQDFELQYMDFLFQNLEKLLNHYQRD